LEERVADMISKAASECWFLECGKITKCSEREKWKMIDRLTNQCNFNEVQAICKVKMIRLHFSLV